MLYTLYLNLAILLTLLAVPELFLIVSVIESLNFKH